MTESAVEMQDSRQSEGQFRDSVIRRRARTGERVVMEWKNLFYSVIVGRGEHLREQVILKDLTGTAQSGQLVAILGPTGSGKTSFLNILAARTLKVKESKLTGEILVNGQPRNNAVFKAISAYVQQDDVLFAHLTVKETLMLSAQFYLPSTLSHKEKEDMVEAIIMELGLAKAKNTIIGNEKQRGVSGGERKRANIGVELISDPAVLFLDEPTSGLDSFQAQSVMAAMKTMASNGRLVMSVIHQPRSSIFAMFDQMLLISEGRTIYYGDASDTVAYFEANGFPCPRLYNPADFFLDILSMDYRTKEAEDETRARINVLAEKWASGAGRKMADLEIVPLEEGRAGQLAAVPSAAATKLPEIGYRSSWFTQFYLLLWRAFNETRRNKMAVGIRFVTTIFFALILAAIYQNLGNDQNSIQDRIGLLFFICINQCFGSMFGVLNTFPEERKVINRERAGKAYRISAYYFAKFLAELPFNGLPPLLFGIIIYWAVGLNPDPGRFGMFLLIVILESLAAVGLGLAISAVSPSVEAANALGPPIVIVLLLFGGFYINIDSLPVGSKWVTYISLLKWAFEALSINEFTGETFTCKSSDLSCQKNGEAVLDRLSFADATVGEALLGLFLVFLGYNFLAYCFIRITRKRYQELGYVGPKYSRLASAVDAAAPAAVGVPTGGAPLTNS